MKVLSKLMVVNLFFSQIAFAKEVVAEQVSCQISIVARCMCDASMGVECKTESGTKLSGMIADTQKGVNQAEFYVELTDGKKATVVVSQLDQDIRSYYGGKQVLKEKSFLEKLKSSNITAENVQRISLVKFQILSTDLNLYADENMSFAHYEKGNLKLSESSPTYYSAFTGEATYVEAKNCSKKVMLNTIKVYYLNEYGRVDSYDSRVWCPEGTATSEQCALDNSFIYDESTDTFSCI